MKTTLEGFETKNNLRKHGIQFSLHFPSVMPRMFKEEWDKKVPVDPSFPGFFVQPRGTRRGVERGGFLGLARGGFLGLAWDWPALVVCAQGSGSRLESGLCSSVSRLRGEAGAGPSDWERTKD